MDYICLLSPQWVGAQLGDAAPAVPMYGMYGLYGMYGVYGMYGMYGVYGMYGLYGMYGMYGMPSFLVDTHRLQSLILRKKTLFPLVHVFTH